MTEPTAPARHKALLLCLAVLFLASPLLSLRLDPNGYEGGRSRDVQDRTDRNASSFAMMIGEFRTSMSDILFIKTERYLHGGVAYSPHMQAQSVTEEIDEMEHHQLEAFDLDHYHHHHHDHHHDHHHAHDDDDHAGTPTLIRPPERDFRGFIGRLHREVKPWLHPDEPHIHSDGEELLPWFRIMTVADPHNVRAYAIGSWWLKNRNLEQGLEFVAEGLRNNPRAFQLHYVQAGLFVDRAMEIARDRHEGSRNNPESLALLRSAQEGNERAFRLGIERRPAEYDPDGPNFPNWRHYDEGDLRGAARMAVILEREYGDRARALQLAREFEPMLTPAGDGILRRIIRDLEATE